jgi:hypothetical protein
MRPSAPAMAILTGAGVVKVGVSVAEPAEARERR